MLGAVTALMLLIWLSRTTHWVRSPAHVALAGDPASQPVPPAEQPGGELQPPGAEELPETGEPPPELVLERIAATVESQVVSLEALTIAEGDGDEGRKKGDDGGGPVGDGPFIGRSPWDRWEIRYSARDLEEYKRQLDFFGIEFGVAGGGDPQVHYIKDFSSARPTIRTGHSRDEKRIRFLYVDGPLKRADREIAQAAGVVTEGRTVFQFHTTEMYNTLLKLENDRMRPRRISEVVRTVFAVRKTENGYELYVIRQDYRAPGITPPRRTAI
ncbi:MAG TPA: hypothetical protein VMP01_26295 [Pirellulaceae bacterium]|nr:hypothetical protein [Pirellulaceae bacterium]